MALLIGTSGWQYRDWRGVLYPPDVPQKRWLEHHLERFRTVEVNATFYRLPKAETVRAWADRSPDDAVIAIKASRFLTHVKRLRDWDEPLERFVENAVRPLGRKLGPLLIQLPPDMKADVPALDAALALLPSHVRAAVETRHPSWWTDELAEVLARHDAAHVWADRRGEPLGPVWRTASWGYLRLHEGTADPWPCYTDAELDAWVQQCSAAGLGAPGGADLYAYWNNDPKGCAIVDAVRFAELARAAGLEPTRVPHDAPARIEAGAPAT